MSRQHVQRKSVRRRSLDDVGARYVLGVDIGLVHSLTAIVLLERVFVEENDRPQYHVKHQKQFPAGTETPTIIEWIVKFLAHRELEDCELVVDATGIGRPIVQEMRRQGLRPIDISITGGNKTHRNNVAKQNLVDNLVLLLQQRRLRIPEEIKLLSHLLDQFDSFEVKYSATGNRTYRARGGAYDDLLLALMLACYQFERRHRSTRLVQATVVGPRVSWAVGRRESFYDELYPLLH